MEIVSSLEISKNIANIESKIAAKTNQTKEFSKEYFKLKTEYNTLPIKIKAEVDNNINTTKSSLIEIISSFNNTWDDSNHKLIKAVSLLPAEVKPLFEAQLQMSKVNLDSQIITRVADTMGASIRKLMQIGGN